MKNLLFATLVSVVVSLFAVPAMANTNVSVTTPGASSAVQVQTPPAATTTVSIDVNDHMWPVRWNMALFGWFGVIGSLFFLFFVLVIIGGLCENDHEFGAFVLSLAALWAFWWSGFVGHEVTFKGVAEVVGGYVLAGFLWALIKWITYSFSQLRIVRAHKRNFDDVAKKNYGTFKDYLSHMGYEWYNSPNFAPDPTTRKAKITTWMAWWPASMIWTVLSKWLLEFWEIVQENTVGLFRGISAGMFKGMGDDENK